MPKRKRHHEATTGTRKARTQARVAQGQEERLRRFQEYESLSSADVMDDRLWEWEPRKLAAEEDPCWTACLGGGSPQGAA